MNIKYKNAKVFSYRDSNGKEILKELLYLEKIKPEKAIKEKNAYEIIYVPPQFVLNGFIVTLVNKIVHHVHVFGLHPNADMNTKEFCLPEHKLQTEYDDIYYDLLRSNLKTYYLDNAHFIPEKLELKKLKSIYLQFNR
jgi:hypothetical protein